MVHSKDELVKNLGNKVALEGTYEVRETGEHVHANDFDVMLDIPGEFFNWGKAGAPEGSRVRASGVVARGAMSLGVYIDEQTLSLRRGSAERPLVSGFVLRDAKVQRLDVPGVTSQPGAK